MKRENVLKSASGEPTSRITRAQAAACRQSGGMPYREQSKEQNKKRVLRASSRRAAFQDENEHAQVTASVQEKRRAVLKDIRNVCCEDSYRKCLNANKILKKTKKGRETPIKLSKVAPSVEPEVQHLPVDSATSMQGIKKGCVKDSQLKMKEKRNLLTLQSTSVKENNTDNGKSAAPAMADITDIDADYMDPLLCSFYAPDIYGYLRAAELIKRPNSSYMERIQRDINENMRGILVDWLVEVCAEYKLVPDTLYLAVYLVDIFLSQKYIERKRLQLLGITCVLIASKYEEICAPHVDELCAITDNTYTKAEVLELETEVLVYSGFRLSLPTIKTFLRRFLRAAQASYQGPSLELEFLANYLAELTLIHYSFLKFLPSAIAASAVFLARWTQEQSHHPWNPTLEHYTNYKSSDLKTIVCALQCLQLNSDRSPLTATRAKYHQDKFKGIAALPSPKLFDTLFHT